MPADEAVTETPPRKIAIVGKAPSSRHLAPDDDASWEIWTLSDLVPVGQVTRFDVHFELHPLSMLANRPPYIEWLQSVESQPIFMIDKEPSIPASQPFPLQQLLAAFGGCRYWTNTVSYMIGLAVMQQPHTIGVWGVDMAQNGPRRDAEYREQRPSCEWLIGWAMGAGIDVVLPKECDLLQTPYLYGFEHRKGGAMREKWVARNEELQTRIQNQRRKADEAQQQAQQHMMNIASLQGALESQQYYEQWTWPDWEAECNSSS
jgi:hypothetical protein